MKPLWKNIWGLEVPNKVKNLVWRACKNALLTKVNLVRCKIITDSLCDICRMHQEDTNHALYCCPALDSMWRQIPMWNHDALKGSRTFTDLIEFVFAGNKESELFSVVIWNSWNRRNNLWLGKATLPLDKIIEHSREWQLEPFVPPATSSLHRTNIRWPGLLQKPRDTRSTMMQQLLLKTTKLAWGL